MRQEGQPANRSTGKSASTGGVSKLWLANAAGHPALADCRLTGWPVGHPWVLYV